MDPRQKLGEKGEKLAEKFLRRKGFRVRARGYRCRWGEIDLIAQHKDSIVFIEVRTQSSDRFGSAYDALTSAKKLHVRRAAKHYLQKYRLTDKPYRYDFIQIVINKTDPPQIEHIEDVF